MATRNAHWQAAFRRRMREAGLKALTVWLPKEGAVRLARYPERERGEIITRALMLLESQGESTGGAEEPSLSALAQKVTGLSTQLERIEAILSTITGESTDKSTGEAVSEAINAQTVEPEEAVALSETPPVAELTDTHPVRLPPKRVAALIRRAKRLSAQGVSWKEIAHRFNVENVPTLSGTGRWWGSTVRHMIEKLGTSRALSSPRDKQGRE